MTDADLHTMPLVDQLLTLAFIALTVVAIMIAVLLPGFAPTSPAGSPDPQPSPAASPTGSGHPSSVGEDPAADAAASSPASAAEPDVTYAAVFDDVAAVPDLHVDVDDLVLPDLVQPPTIPADLAPLAEAIARCESGGLWDGRDGDLSGRAPLSTASGRWRFSDPTWRWTWDDLIGQPPPTATAREATPTDQTRAFVALHDAMGTSPWAASESCWRAEVGR